MRVALLSFWHLHGKDYALAAENHPDVEIAAIWDENPARGQEEAAARSIPFVLDLDEVLADPSIDGVVVCTPTSDHRDVVVACARAGKHIFMEKVLADTLDEAEEIARAAEEAGVVLTVSLWRSDRGYAGQIARLVADGAVGDVTSARIRDGHPFALPSVDHPTGILPESFYDLAPARGGALIDLCHPVYLMALICGLPIQLSAAFGHVTHRPVEDNAAVVMTYPGGAIGITETTYTSRITPFTIEVHGTAGSLLYSEPGIGALVHARQHETSTTKTSHEDVPALRVFTGAGSDARWRDVEVEPDQPEAFTRWVRLATEGTPDTENVRLALDLSAMIEAAYASASTGAHIAVRHPELDRGGVHA